MNKFTFLLGGQVGAIRAGKRQHAEGDELLRQTEYTKHKHHVPCASQKKGSYLMHHEEERKAEQFLKN